MPEETTVKKEVVDQRDPEKDSSKDPDVQAIPVVKIEDEVETTDGIGDDPKALESLGVRFMEQDSLERSVAEEATKAMTEKDIEVEKKRLTKAVNRYEKLRGKLRSMEYKLNNASTRISEKERVRQQKELLEKGELAEAMKDMSDIRSRLRDAEKSKRNKPQGIENSGPQQLPDETRQEFLIRSGKVTAFGSSSRFIEDLTTHEDEAISHQNLRLPGLHDDDFEQEPIDIASDDDAEDDDEDVEIIEELFSDDDIDVSKPKRKKHIINEEDEFRNIDDGDEKVYQNRLEQWVTKRSALRKIHRPDYVDDPNKPEWVKPHPTVNDAILNDEFRVPGDIYPSLFDYQKTGVQWLWELYSQKTGGIIGDEMGLGKTVQIIAFLAGLQYSGLLKGPCLVVCPATVMRQWCNEFHRWWPAFRVVILHSIGSGMAAGKSKRNWSDDDDDEDSEHHSVTEDRAKELIENVVKNGHVIVTTYVGVRIYSKYLLPVRWQYVVLDEGHKIRNPDSYVTLTCKQLRTPNRIILSGTPIQNNLVELWSLFDFIFPGRLGTLPVFQKQFCVPINLGGYANATNVQVQTGYKCAVILKDLISPYLLRRVKADVAQDLPKKSEMVLFCKLTPEQRMMYENFLHSEDLERILKGKRNALYGIDVLRKISNHPDLVLAKKTGGEDVELARKGQTAEQLAEKSGKMQVVKLLLELWNKEGRKALIFTQTRQMLDILQDFMDAMNSEHDNQYGYARMDGTTPISDRQALVDTFNTDPNYKVFLLTTRVGGLGINLTGASRVIIYDPDWNPSTDMQARERAWRLGQKKDVTIYRLMVAGSIEEKIYHRQIFKQFLTNKILKDPKQKRFFKMTDMYDLFSLGDQDTKGTETADLFGANETNYEGTNERKSRYLSGVRRSRVPTKDGDSDDFLQVSKMKGVSSLQQYDTGEGAKKDSNEEVDETGLVSQIFKNSGGVHSAIEHDSIMGSSDVPSIGIIETEASRIANDAVKALRESRKLSRATAVSVPTWTGRSGAAGRRRQIGSVPKRRKIPVQGSSGLSSSSILQSIERKKKDTGVLKPVRSPSASPAPTGSDDDAKTQKLVADLSTYMSSLDGFFSTSGQVLDHLHINVNDEKEVKVLRMMLRNICKWDKQRRGWILNEEFR